jgi:hypothetical protein
MTSSLMNESTSELLTRVRTEVERHNYTLGNEILQFQHNQQLEHAEAALRKSHSELEEKQAKWGRKERQLLEAQQQREAILNIKLTRVQKENIALTTRISAAAAAQIPPPPPCSKYVAIIDCDCDGDSDSDCVVVCCMLYVCLYVYYVSIDQV